MSRKPLPAVKAILERDGKILALKTEAGGSSYWVLPGGKIEYGEEPREALKREIQEEISCKVEIKDPVGMYHFFTGPEGKGDQVVLTAFKADIGEQEIDISDNPADENISEYRWLEPREFMKRTENNSLEKLIREYVFDTPKLVRDKIPEIMVGDGENPQARKVEGEELTEFLLDKIVEEARELSESGEDEELADLMEVLDKYRSVSNIRLEKINELRSSKKDDRGGFSEGYVLEDF